MKIITGMHRSGTSMTTNLLMEISGQQIQPDDNITSDQWNPKGYFENTEIVVLNNSILLGKYAPSSQILMDPMLKSKKIKKAILGIFNFRYLWILLWPNLINRSAARYKNEIDALSHKYDRYIIKDPRFSLLLAPWQQWGKIDKVLVCFRDPEEVARSLKKRNGLPMALGLWLWKFHNERLLKSIESFRDEQRIFIYFNNFFHPQKMEKEVQRLFAFLDIPHDAQQARQILSRVLDDELKHYNNIAASYPEDIRKILDRLFQYHETPV